MKNKFEIYADRYKVIGLNVSHYRKIRGITQMKLAELAGVSLSWITHIENGAYNVSLYTLFLIADVLDIHWSKLFISPDNDTI
ncbi:helix-turn-helix transcriptional regulator [Oscillospiraceae bacterium OttesenSCG-928-F05]|nr:helix-turn-helix transcriptional regulator [Oscillospiraceae bacterium OttesenSCG-928-F05]